MLPEPNTGITRNNSQTPANILISISNINGFWSSMKHFAIDYSVLDTKIDNKTFRLVDVKDRLEKVAFDVVRFKDGNPEELWQIQNGDDGDYIVAKYEADSPEKINVVASAKTWDVLVNSPSGDINIFYKGFPVVKTSAHKLGLPMEDLDTVKRFLPNKLQADKQLVQSLLKNLGTTERFELLRLYPELS